MGRYDSIVKILMTGLAMAGGLSTHISSENPSNKGAFLYNEVAEIEDFSNVSSDELSASVIQNATTELTQFYTIKFSTSQSLYSSVRYPCVTLAVTDPSFDPSLLVEHEDASEIPTYSAQIYSIKGVEGNQFSKNIILPKSATFTKSFIFDITEIKSHALLSCAGVETITIPDSITTIAADSFEGVESDIAFRCVGSSSQSGWAEGWNQGNEVTYNYSPAADENRQMINASYPSAADNNNGNRFYIGYYDHSTNWQPLVLYYDVEKADGSVDHRTKEFDLHSNNSLYDAVGTPIGQEKTDLSITLDVASGEKVKDDSLVAANLYRAKMVENKYMPDTSEALKIKVANTCKRFYLDDFIKIRSSGIATFANQTEIDILVDTVPGIYEQVKGSIYDQYRNDIANGTCVVRYRFTSLFNASYRITYESNGNIVVKDYPVVSPYTFYNLDKDVDNRVGFLLDNSLIGEDFDAKKLLKVDLMNFYVTVDLYSYTTKNIVSAQCAYNVKFGVSNILDLSKNAVPHTDLDSAMVVIIFAGIATYLIASVVLYFILKNVFKNDEFRRVNGKSFLKKALIYFIGFAFIVMSITFIVFRWAFLDNSIVVFNPLDALVIIFTLGGLISLGLFIRDFVVAIQVSIKRKATIKLKLNELTDDDGTK